MPSSMSRDSDMLERDSVISESVKYLDAKVNFIMAWDNHVVLFCAHCAFSWLLSSLFRYFFHFLSLWWGHHIWCLVSVHAPWVLPTPRLVSGQKPLTLYRASADGFPRNSQRAVCLWGHQQHGPGGCVPRHLAEAWVRSSSKAVWCSLACQGAHLLQPSFHVTQGSQKCVWPRSSTWHLISLILRPPGDSHAGSDLRMKVGCFSSLPRCKLILPLLKSEFTFYNWQPSSCCWMY